MKNLKLLLLVAPLFILNSCTGVSTNQAPVEKANANLSIPKSSISLGEGWENIVQQSKKEKRVVVYSTAGGQTRNAIIEGFKNKWGLDAELITGRGNAIVQRLLSEKRAGLNTVDVYIGGFSTILLQLKPFDILESLPPVLVLPEVKEGKYWWKDELRWVDKDKKVLSSWAYPSGQLALNVNLVKENEVTSVKELLNPKWKRKIVMDDPSTEGPGVPWFMTTVRNVGIDFMKDLARQEPAIIRDERLPVEWLAQGKYAFAIATASEILEEFRQAGAAIGTVSPPEIVYLAGGSGSISFIKEAPHPMSARLFINWFLSREGQLIVTRAQGVQSARVDLPTDFLNTNKIRNPGIDYFEMAKEEHLPLRVESTKLAREIFGPLLK